MRRAALAVGSEVPRGAFEFRVHSVFDSAMNLAVEGRRGLVALVGIGADELPQGIRLTTRERFGEWPTPVGTRGRRRGGTLVFGDPDGAELVAIDLSAIFPTMRKALPYIDPREDAAREAWAACAFHLDGLQEERDVDLRLAALCGMSSPPTTLGERLVHAACELASAVRTGNAGSAGSAATRITGLGAGLTPSGDDFLCGLLAALWSMSREGSPHRRFVVEWGAALADQLDSTNAISATYLECAIAGCFPGAVHALAAAMAGDPAGQTTEDSRRALDGLCAVGHSSGMDTATGFLFGLWLRTDDDEEIRRYAPQL